jgi:hypothetical protein
VAIKSLNLVIDADIARSSGLSEHPVSSGARKLLDLVKTTGHCVVMCPILRAEWNKHQSIYAQKWFASMIAKKKVKFITHESKVKQFIEENVSDEKLREIASKDSHLVDAALLEDKFIASNDCRARNAFCEISVQHKILEDLVWLHSCSDYDFIEKYLSKSCFIPQEKFLKKLEN